MRKTLVVALSLSALFVGGSAVWVSAASAITAPEHFTLVGPDTEEANIDLGDPGPSLGDQFVFSGPLNGAGRVESGRVDGHCIVTSNPVPSHQERQQCFVTATIGTENGETEIEMTGVGRIEAEDVGFAVTGGTGKYANVRGQVVVDYTDERGIKLKFNLIP